ncbi:glycosyltransferase [Cobetia sp. MC34]|uniref:glycosyltransferase n=1 Tax=Cobetia sp. MC34 TaxID=2785080 RepID=UPI001BC9B23B|nr:glycosyltransferase [Cobetia sp. MC34]MBS4154782.1 glycosyltransferase [Cobetia sp. MC34]
MSGKGMVDNKETTKTEHVLDLEYYKSRYHDLKMMSDTQVINHWHNYGKPEGRVCSGDHAKSLMLKTDNINTKEYATSTPTDSQKKKSATDFKEFKQVQNISPMKPFDDAFYAALYPDLEKTQFYKEKKLYKHYEMFGELEDRIATLSQWLNRHAYPEVIASHEFDYATICQLNSALGIDVTLKDVLGTFSAEINAPVSFYEDNHKNAEFYLRVARYYLEIGDKIKAKKLLESSNSFFSLSASLELLGNIYLDQGHNRIALGYYNSAKALSNPPKWLYFNRATCLVRLQQYEKALASLAEGLEAYGEFTFQQEKLDEFAEEAWNNVFPALLSYVGQGNREELVRAFDAFSDVVYDAYLRACGASENPAVLPSLNLDRILIVGDYHVAQCERYRINQKVEQLEAVGKEVTAIDWLEVDQHAEALATHDVVIFYRVPAMPKVLKAMAQTNAVGKLSIYEIDDLIFDPVYPPALASYGGYVSLETYQELTRGMALFHGAARHCRLGLASTEPLRERLAELVFGKECLLHRNGLDSLNAFSQPLDSPKKTLDIFYGSGTQAHNQDFMDLALPAIVKLLDQYPHLRLVVVGYLRLPKSFTDRFADQLSMIPPLKSVQGYWSLLRRADINLAVLHDDVMNECKSELKWFEAACHGVPSVVSSTQNYRDVIRDGEDAFLAVTADDWESAITRLVEDKSLRHAMGKAAQQRTRDEYSLEVLGSQLASDLEDQANRLMESASHVDDGDGQTILVRKKRKIALVNVFFPPQSIGGATRVVDDNFKALRKHFGDDFELVVFTADSECRTPHQLSMYQHEGVRVYRTTTLWRENMDWHAKDERMHQMFTEFLECERPDMVHFHCVQRLTGSVVEAARDAKIPYIVTAHDAWWISDFQFLVDHEGTVYPEGHPDPFATIGLPPSITQEASVERKLYLKGLLSSAHKVLTVSNAFADIYRKNDIVDIEVTPNGISDDLPWAPKDTSYTKRVVGGHVGGMAEHKGYFLLKQAVMEAQPDNMEFLVVDHSKEEGYESRQFWGKVPVRFIGRTSQDKVVDIYRQIDILFAPSTWPESFGLVTREAAACGCWIVASNLGGIGEDVDVNTGSVIKPTSDALANILLSTDVRMKDVSTSKGYYFSSSQVLDLAGYYGA